MNRISLKTEALTGQTVGVFFFFFFSKAIIYSIIRNKWQVMSSYSILVKWSAFGVHGFRDRFIAQGEGKVLQNTVHKKIFLCLISLIMTLLYSRMRSDHTRDT